jgi:hypothetical protein
MKNVTAYASIGVAAGVDAVARQANLLFRHKHIFSLMRGICAMA